MVNDAMLGEERTRRIESLVARLLEQVAHAPAQELHVQSAPGEWTAMQSLAHVAELLPYWSRQARDVAARRENDQPFGRTHDDPERIAAVATGAEDALAEVVPRVRGALVECEATLRAIPAQGWLRTGRHMRRGEMTVLQIVDQFLVEHMEEHLYQVEAVLRASGRPKEEAS